MQGSAAFYDVDGTLIKTNIVHAFAWYAMNQPTLRGSFIKSVRTALSLPAPGSTSLSAILRSSSGSWAA